MPRVSVIIPVYNAEEYLADALKSLESQIFKDFEVLLMDDGSTDGSYEVFEKYRYSMDIAWYASPCNQGAAMARNRGLVIATGEYILFLDADDIFDSRLICYCVKTIEKNESDVVLVNYDSFRNVEEISTFNLSDSLDLFFENKRSAVCSFSDIPEEYFQLICVPWNKLIKKEYLIKQRILFQNLVSSNDVYFGHMVLMKGKISLEESDIPLIHYRVGTKSQISSKRQISCEIEAYEKIISEIKQEKAMIPFLNNVLENYLYGICKHLKLCKNDEVKDAYLEFKNEIFVRHRVFSQEFLYANHQYLLETMASDTENDCDWAKTNFRFEEYLHNNISGIRSVLELYSNHCFVFLEEDIKSLKFRLLFPEFKYVQHSDSIKNKDCILLVMNYMELTKARKVMKNYKDIFLVYKREVVHNLC